LVRAVVSTDGKAVSPERICEDLTHDVDTALTLKPRYLPGFPVVVCEDLADESKEGAKVGGREVKWEAFRTKGGPAVKRVVVIGDTGCRNAPKYKQKCEGVVDPSKGETRWIFDEVANSASDPPPHLVIHVGDYRYKNEDHKDQWPDWKNDFFEPASELLAAAPWITARGNHDVCFKKSDGWKGDGWRLFFGRGDVDSHGKLKSCQEIEAEADAKLKFLPPQAFDVADSLRWLCWTPAILRTIARFGVTYLTGRVRVVKA
jgi:Calcineurin-like phosphoesterase